MAIAYSAHTESCTFFLDDDGICRQIVRRAGAVRGLGRGAADTAGRCIGAQYVASIDLRADGGLVPMPQVGSPMLFAYVAETGRIALVRTGALVRFEERGGSASSGVRAAPARPAYREVPRAESDEYDDEEDIATRRFAHQMIAPRRAEPVRVVSVKPPATPSAPTLPWQGRGDKKLRGMLPRSSRG